MNLKTNVVIEIVKNDRVYCFTMPVGAPFGEAYDAAFEVLQNIIEFSKQAADKAKQTPVDKDSN